MATSPVVGFIVKMSVPVDRGVIQVGIVDITEDEDHCHCEHEHEQDGHQDVSVSVAENLAAEPCHDDQGKDNDQSCRYQEINCFLSHLLLVKLIGVQHLRVARQSIAVDWVDRTGISAVTAPSKSINGGWIT